MNVDTNVDNYDLEEMVNLFKISTNLTDEHMLKMNETIHKLNFSIAEDDLEPEIRLLFKRIFVILSCLHKYRDYLKIKNVGYQCKKEDDQKLISFIKRQTNYEDTNDMNLLLNKMLMSEETTTDETQKNSYQISYQPSEQMKNIEIQKVTDSQHPLVVDIHTSKVLNTYDNKLVSGDINSIKRITKLVNLHIDSCFRDKYYNSNPCNFVYVLPKQFKNVVSLKLASIEIPNAWYLFSHLKKNNTFIIEITYCGKCSLYTIVIPDGNYTNDTLVSFLNMKYFYQTTIHDTPLKHIKFSINEYTNRSQFEINDSAPDDFVFSLHFTSEQTENMLETAGWILGFRLARYLKIEDYILSEGLFDAGGDRYIYLTINDYQYNYNETNIICFDKSSMDAYTLAKIPLVNGKLSLVIDENNKNPLVKIRQYNGPVNLTKFEIKILDKYGNIIDLNYMDFSFSLELEVLYERSNII